VAPDNKSVVDLVAKAKERMVKERAAFVKSSIASAAKAIETKDFAPAVKLLERVRAADPENAQAAKLYAVASKADTSVRTKEADELLAEADMFEKNKRFEIALARMEKAAALMPERQDLAQRLTALREQVAVRNMMLVEAGEFIFGDAKQGLLRRPYKVNLPAFYIDRFPVTNAEYKRFCEATDRPRPNHWNNGDFQRGQANHPVSNVSFFDAKAYAKWAGKRLPCEEEWEKAARGTDGRKYPWGNEMGEMMCNPGTEGTTPIDKYPRAQSPYGVIDMVGNVWEWCDSRVGGDEKYRFRRGGLGSKLGCTTRKRVAAKHFYMDLGFRCAKDATQ